MKLWGFLLVIERSCSVASAADGQALANSLHIMMDLASLTVGAAINIFPSTGDRFLLNKDVVGGFELITTAAENEVLILSQGESVLADESVEMDVCENYSQFVEVQLALITILINKQDTLAQATGDATVNTALLELDERLGECSAAVGALATSMAPLVPGCGTTVVEDEDDYQEALTELRGVLLDMQSGTE
ncbi:hypothetical protein BJY04DRAFT_225048 [Aspergillus karnatakaensis]|uniref:uncharacterized protein n=1 Tax=Aspergillus karnatakaensis TaxID=1810916 RepID=UPI003CCD04EA